MIRWIVETSLRFKGLVLVLAVIIMLVGLTILKKIPIDVFPEFEPPTIEIQTEALGLSAAEVESLVTFNIEEMLAGTPWLQSIHSESIPGLSSIVLIFKPGTNLLVARQFVQESLSRAYTLPNVSKPPIMLQPVSSTRRVMMVGLSSNSLSPIEMSVLAQWTIKPRLMAIAGVANVVIWGQKNRQLQVLIDPKRLEANHLTQDQIIRTAGDSLWYSRLSFLHASAPGTGGWIDTPNQRLNIRHVFPISSAAELAKLPIYDSTLRLGDVAEVVEGHPPLIGDIILDNNPGIILVIEKFPNANVLEVTKNVEKTLNTLKAGLPGIEIDTQIFQLANFINAAFDNLTIALLISAVLIALVLILFINDWRKALIIFFTIPLSILAAIIVLYFCHMSLNLLVLAGFGIALAVMVDDSVIHIANIMSNIHKQRKAGLTTPVSKLILDAALEIRTPIIYATLIMILAILPIFFLGGFASDFFKPLAYAYSLALIASMLIAFTLTPTLAYFILQTKKPVHERTYQARLRDKYKFLLNKLIGSPKIVYAIVIVLIVIGLLLWLLMSQSLLPSFRERNLIIEVDGIPSMSYPEMTRVLQRITQDIKTIPDINKVAALTGRAITSDKITDIDSGEIWVDLKPKANFEQVKNDVGTVLSNYPGFEFDVQTFLDHRMKKIITGENENLMVRINGPNWDKLQEIAEQVQQALAKIKGITHLTTEGQVYEPQIDIKVDPNKAAPYGIKPGDVRRGAATIFAGIEAGSIFEQQKVFDVVIWSIPQARNSLTNVENLMIDKPGGGYVRLGDIANVNIVPTPTVISHYGISPYIDIVANVQGASVDTAMREAEAVLEKINFPLEYHPQILGVYFEQQAVQQNLTIAVIGVIVIIFFLLQAAFSSWKLALLELLSLPIAFIGGLIALAFNGGVISMGAMVGFLAVLGLAVRHGILLIKHFQNLQYEQGLPFSTELIVRGTSERLTSILITTITTAVALLPFLFFGDAPGLEIIHPMAVVIFGGLITSTFLNLMIIPPLYLLCGANIKPDAEKL